MLLFLKRKHEDEDETIQAPPPPPPARTIPASEFIPYYCHFNPHTLLTKNGELLQIIKIASNTSGLDYESGDGMNTVRETIRTAITETVKSDRFSFWIHTIRKRRPISYQSNFEEPFAAYLHQAWQKAHPWKYQYYNELYVTVLHDGQTAELFDKKQLKHVAFSNSNRAYRNRYLDAAFAELDGVVSGVLTRIRGHYNTHRLAVVERPANGGGVFYSEPMEFLGTILNLRVEPFPVRETDLGDALSTHQLTFGFNALETKSGASEQRRFGALLTLKAYREIPPETADRVLQSPIELIVSEAFSFIPHTVALKQYREQKTLFDISGDTYSPKSSGLEEMLAGNRKNPVDFGQHQISIMVIVDDYRHLDPEVSKVQTTFAELGLITIREDIRLEDCFWAQLPANFEFIRRKDIVRTSRIGGFCRLNRFPGGADAGNHWNEAVALIPTVVNSPYFFSFHAQDNGHTVCFDFNSFHDQNGSVLFNFLLTSTLKFRGKLFLFDRNRSGRLLFDRLGAPYRIADWRRKNPSLQINPFALEDSPHNHSFLLAWCMALIEPSFTVTERHRDLLRASIDQLYAGSPSQRHLPGLAALLSASDPDLAAPFMEFTGQGKWAGLFDATADSLTMEQAVQAFDLTAALKHPIAGMSLFAYLLHRIINAIDGQPTLIAVHEAQDLLENPFFAPRLESLLEMLRENNIMMLFTTNSPEEAAKTQSFSILINACGTRMYLPDDIAIDYTSEALGLTDHDSRLLRRMDRQKGDFLIKQKGESIGLRADLSDLDDIKCILANDVKNLIAAGGKFSSLPQWDD